MKTKDIIKSLTVMVTDINFGPGEWKLSDFYIEVSPEDHDGYVNALYVDGLEREASYRRDMDFLQNKCGAEPKPYPGNGLYSDLEDMKENGFFRFGIRIKRNLDMNSSEKPRAVRMTPDERDLL